MSQHAYPMTKYILPKNPATSKYYQLLLNLWHLRPSKKKLGTSKELLISSKTPTPPQQQQQQFHFIYSFIFSFFLGGGVAQPVTKTKIHHNIIRFDLEVWTHGFLADTT